MLPWEFFLCKKCAVAQSTAVLFVLFFFYDLALGLWPSYLNLPHGPRWLQQHTYLNTWLQAVYWGEECKQMQTSPQAGIPGATASRGEVAEEEAEEGRRARVPPRTNGHSPRSWPMADWFMDECIMLSDCTLGGRGGIWLPAGSSGSITESLAPSEPAYVFCFLFFLIFFFTRPPYSDGAGRASES